MTQKENKKAKIEDLINILDVNDIDIDDAIDFLLVQKTKKEKSISLGEYKNANKTQKIGN